MDGLKPVLLGLALGVLSVFALTKAVASLLFFAVSASDPAALIWVTILFCSVSLVAVIVPAHRVAKMDSLAVLRTN